MRVWQSRTHEWETSTGDFVLDFVLRASGGKRVSGFVLLTHSGGTRRKLPGSRTAWHLNPYNVVVQGAKAHAGYTAGTVYHLSRVTVECYDGKAMKTRTRKSGVLSNGEGSALSSTNLAQNKFCHPPNHCKLLK